MCYDRAGPAVVEVAFVVEDAWQGHGIATALLYRLAAYARDRGIVELVALTMSVNTRMHTLLRQSGFPASVIPCDDLTEVRLDISQPPARRLMEIPGARHGRERRRQYWNSLVPLWQFE